MSQLMDGWMSPANPVMNRHASCVVKVKDIKTGMSSVGQRMPSGRVCKGEQVTE